MDADEIYDPSAYMADANTHPSMAFTHLNFNFNIH